MICTTTPQMENCGSSRVPSMGRSRLITPLRSLSSDTTNSTGSLVAVGLSTCSPK